VSGDIVTRGSGFCTVVDDDDPPELQPATSTAAASDGTARVRNTVMDITSRQQEDATGSHIVLRWRAFETAGN